MKNIQLTLSTDEANMVLAALGDKPYIKVADLIQKIQRQGADQLQQDKAPEAKVSQEILKDINPVPNGK